MSVQGDQGDKLVEEIHASERRRKRAYWIVGIATVVFILGGLAAGLYLQYQALESLKGQNDALEIQGDALEDLIQANRATERRFRNLGVIQHRRIEALLLEIARRAGLPVRDLIELLKESESGQRSGRRGDSDGEGQRDNDGTGPSSDGGGNDSDDRGPRPRPDRPCDVKVDPVCVRTSPTPDIEITPGPARADESAGLGGVVAAAVLILVLAAASSRR